MTTKNTEERTQKEQKERLAAHNVETHRTVPGTERLVGKPVTPEELVETARDVQTHKPPTDRFRRDPSVDQVAIDTL